MYLKSSAIHCQVRSRLLSFSPNRLTATSLAARLKRREPVKGFLRPFEGTGMQRHHYMHHGETEREAAKRMLDAIARHSRELRERGEAVPALALDVAQVLRQIAAGKPVPGSVVDKTIVAGGKLKQALVFQILKRFPRPWHRGCACRSAG